MLVDDQGVHTGPKGKSPKQSLVRVQRALFIPIDSMQIDSEL